MARTSGQYRVGNGVSPPGPDDPPDTTAVTIGGIEFTLSGTNLLSGFPQVGDLSSMSIEGYGDRLVDRRHNYVWSAETLSFDNSGTTIEIRVYVVISPLLILLIQISLRVMVAVNM